MPSISSFENTSVVSDTKMFFVITASVADTVAINPKGTQML